MYSILFLSVVALVTAYEPEMDQDAIGMIEYWGYPAETYIARTEDGWLLPIYRIPYGRNDTADNSTRPVIILQHGFECIADNWIMNPPSTGAGYIFADAGFDVWIFNSRGTYRAEHENYTSDEPGFWNYTYVDMVTYDLDSTFDKVEEVTGQKAFYYVGHSQGTMIMFAKLAEDPSFSNRIIRFFALGPATQMSHAKGAFDVCITTETPIAKQIWNADALSPLYYPIFDPANMANFSKKNCYGNKIKNAVCTALLYTVVGPSKTMNESRIAVYLTHAPGGSSTLNMLMFCQNKLHGGYYKYRYPTKEQNIIAYGQPDPPAYNLTNISAKIHLYSSHQDIITSRIDMDEFTIPRIKEQIVEDNIVDGFSHMDFMFGLEAPEKVFYPIIDTILADL